MGSDPLKRAPVVDTPYGSSREVIPLEKGEEPPWWDFRRAPCFRETLMWSVGGATVLGGMEAIRGRPGVKVGNMFVGTFSFLAITCWGICRYDTRMRHKSVSDAMTAQNVRQQELARAAREQGPPPPAPIPK
eukprot:CAMPEP_0173414596 /NCGR_PEP_ID=MMETSP1356-20130122/84412_1 /TAXON_ID=77927 ORGANISM="Hemiselmis virescens, Strain PCC157" /NCGR_SAMPLE_ID=MMETSP1356 /ASSEMBLY_ACC=CAM_ASM_000847 /LENGTH=131 /DNA_ID=CAMNT_0014376787 /DNA_START=48 /DNA_END=443 /DNA_ORIENTATION=-